MRTHYEFCQTRQHLGVELHLESDAARPLAELVRSYAGKTVAGGACDLVWDPAWSSGRGRLVARFPPDAASETVAQAMHDLISLTISPVGSRLQELYGQWKTMG
jgi:hypothetical protein